MRAETDRQQFSLAQEASRLPIENSLTLVIWSLGVALAYHGSCNVQPLSRTDHCFPALPGAVFFGHCVGPGGFASKPQFILATALDKVPDRSQTPDQDNALRCPSDAFS